MRGKRPIRTDIASIALLCLLVLAFYRHIALTNRILVGVDAFTYFYPYRAYAAQALSSGQIPLWNPYLFLGVPFVANPQAAVFYPLNVALCWLSAPKLVAWSIVLHVALAAGFAYLYARRSLNLSVVPALLAASVFAFGGFLSGQVEHINQLNVSAWFPLLLLLWDLRQRARVPAVIGLGVVVALQLLAGHTQSSYICLTGLGLYALLPTLRALISVLRDLVARAPSDRGHPARSAIGPQQAKNPVVRATSTRTLLDLALLCILGIALAAIQIVPTAELSSLSIRSGGLSYREAVAFSLKPSPRLLRYSFLPPWGGNLVDVFGGPYFTEYMAYVGLLPLLLVTSWIGLSLFRFVKGLKKPANRGSFARGGSQSAAGVEPYRLRDRIFSSLHEFDWASRPARMAWLAAIGLFLAIGLYNPLYYVLYKVVPGFNLFRVPARWLLLYAFGAAMLAGVALQRLLGRKERSLERSPRDDALTGKEPSGLRRARTTGIVSLFAIAFLLITLGELFCAALALPFTHPTTPDAFDSLRTAPAHVLAAQQEQTVPGRFLGMSDIVFDPGDRAEMQAILSSTLSEQEIYDAIVSAKRKEVLAPNLPLAWQIPAVDGYGGGLLPLKRYALVQRLFLDEADLLADGRLGERLTRLPPSRLLSLLNTRFVLTDKVHDVWIDDVFYDLAFDANLQVPPPQSPPAGGRTVATTIAADDLPDFIATGLGIVSTLEGAASVPDGTPVATIELETAAGDRISLALLAGTHTAEGLYGEGIAHTQARIGHTWRDRPEGSDYIARLDWTDPTQITEIRITAQPFGGRLVVRGLSLVDERDGSSVPVLLSTDGCYRQVHSGDVKIYEVLDPLPRAFVVHHTVVEPDDEVALAAMRDPSFDPSQQAFLAEGQALDVQPAASPQVEITSYAPEGVVVETTLGDPGYLVLSDAWYPGWTARVDGELATIERANLTFRAVYLEPGRHEVVFSFQPRTYTWGLAISVVSLIVVIVGMVYCWRKKTRT